jgi:hypothetical protein
MSPILAFVLILLATLAAWWGFSVYKYGFRFDKGIIKGVVLAVAFALLMAGASALFAEEVEWFDDAYVFAGLDYTKKASPMCDSGAGGDDHSTSNIGLRVNVFKYGPMKTNWKYTHHSCAFGEDDKQYDAFIGIELEYKLW